MTIIEKDTINNIINLLNSSLSERLYNYDCIKNYNTLLTVINYLYVNTHNNKIFDSEGFKYLTDKIIKIIWQKIKNNETLSIKEAEVFLYTLYYETIEVLQIDKHKITDMKFIKTGTELLPNNCRGMHKACKDGTEKIYYNNVLITELISENLSISYKITNTMRTICHEIIHSCQNQGTYSDVLTLRGYIHSIETVFRHMNPKYYNENYFFTHAEADAQSGGLLGVIHFLSIHGLANINELNKLLNIAKNYQHTRIDHSNNHAIEYKEKRNKIGRIILYSCSDLLKRYPDLIKTYKTLSISYNTDGSLKSIKQLLYTRKKLLADNPTRRQQIDQIFKYIFNCYFSEQEQEIDKLTELCKYIKNEKDKDAFAEKIFTDIIAKKGGSEQKAKTIINKLI